MQFLSGIGVEASRQLQIACNTVVGRKASTFTLHQVQVEFARVGSYTYTPVHMTSTFKVATVRAIQRDNMRRGGGIDPPILHHFT